ncbi:MAG: hypothetical protein NC081_05105 [Roseburia sp.]|nr:hypothetical protein [Roseburia sp.]
MSRKYLPLILMLVAGAVTCIITFIQNYSIINKLIALLIVLVVFFFLGSVLKSALDYFERQNSVESSKEGEVIEKQVQDEEIQQP